MGRFDYNITIDDEIDAYSRFGIFVTKDGYGELLQWNSIKTPQSNNWYEIDGVEVDLTEPKLDGREINIKVAVIGGYARLNEFVEDINDGISHEFGFHDIGAAYTLRYISHSQAKALNGLLITTLKFAEDRPYIYTEQIHSPTSPIPQSDIYKIDGTPLTAYGVVVLQGTRAEIDKLPDLKDSVVIKNSTQQGWDCIAKATHYKSKDVAIHCLIKASNITELHNNYNALLNALIQSGTRKLYSQYHDREFNCYYKSSKVSGYSIAKCEIDFTITLVFTDYKPLINK